VTTTAAAPAFRVVSDFQPAGDQPKAISELAEGIESGLRYQTLLGITGSGKSATIAWTIEKVQRPTLILAPNKSLAAQLAQEMLAASPKGLRMTKEGLSLAIDAPSLEAAMAIENRNQLMTSASPNVAEGMRAFMEKRAPNYIRD